MEHGRLLGYAIAHEIGHLLLGTTDHTRVGLMRGRWTHESGADKPAQWVFSSAQAISMRNTLKTVALATSTLTAETR
jgi:hypothetical protein